MSGKTRKSSRRVMRSAHRAQGAEGGLRHVPEEVPVAFSFYGTTHAVMMASPADLEDFAVGFCLSDGVIAQADDIEALDIIDVDGGIDLQIKLKQDMRDALKARQRHMAGPVGCGLCGIESIAEALRPVPDVVAGEGHFTSDDITRAVKLLGEKQPLNMQTRAMHAAGFYTRQDGIVAAREDVGRHNALDKLAGALAREEIGGAHGAVVVTSRVSVEMVQKTAQLGASLLIAISAPTALALDVAEDAGICVAALVRGDEFELFTHPEVIVGGRSTHVA